VQSQSDLRQQLDQLDGRGYKAYKAIEDQYHFGGFTLSLDRVQGDPFAAPSQCRVFMPLTVAGFPPDLYRTPSRAIALRDFLTRQFDRISRSWTPRGSGNSGLIAVAKPSQAILDRTGVLLRHKRVELRLVVGLPAQGRRIDGQMAAKMLCDVLPRYIHQSLLYHHLDPQALEHHGAIAEDADWLRQQLAQRNLVAFVANGAILPRRSGVDERPLEHQAIGFQSPASLAVTLTCPNAGAVTGMGIPRGVTLIVGGGYHGKSTLLQALEQGVYNHVPGDGREQVVTLPLAIKIRAEDGRGIAGVNITPFINHLPQGRSTTRFSTQNASGSTSQAANVMEALEAGAQVLLVDEDTAATNFMIRDRRMQLLIAQDQEPITPFVDKVRQLYDDHGVSTILVMGGSGDYFDVADTVIALENFQPRDVTAAARAIATNHQTGRQPEGGQHFGHWVNRIPQPESIDPSRGRRSVTWKVRDCKTLVFGDETIDLSALAQLLEPGQVRAIAAAMVYVHQHHLDQGQSLAQWLGQVMTIIDAQGLDALTPFPDGDLAQFGSLELAAAINRLRSLQVIPHP